MVDYHRGREVRVEEVCGEGRKKNEIILTKIIVATI